MSLILTANQVVLWKVVGSVAAGCPYRIMYQVLILETDQIVRSHDVKLKEEDSHHSVNYGQITYIKKS